MSGFADRESLDGLTGAVSESVEELPAATVRTLADAFERVTDPTGTGRLRVLELAPGPAAREQVDHLFEHWKTAPSVTGQGIGLALRAAAKAREDSRAEQQISAVWTGPSTNIVPVRSSLEVLLEVIRDARSRLVIVSFAAYRVDSVLTELAMAAARGVDVRLILETRDDSEGRLTQNASDAFRSLPASVAFYVWPLERRGASGASLHAKLALADSDVALVTSANLTASALEKNIELGVLVQGGRLPRELMRHFDELVASGELRALMRKASS